MAEIEPHDLSQFLWLVVVAFFLGFVYAFGIGANDVANSFASTVAAKSLSLKQAIIVAGIFEFLGALLLGASVTNTIRSKIFDTNLYEDQPEILMLGLTTSIFTASVMLLVATYFGLPVSTTHTVVGSLMGMSIAAKGFDSINWDTGAKIFISWAASPILGGIIAFIFFFLVRYFVMTAENAFQRAYFAFPIIIIIGLGIDLFFIFYKGFNNFQFSEDMPIITTVPIGFGIGAICALFWLYPLGPYIRARIIRQNDLEASTETENDQKLVAEKRSPAVEDGEEGREVEAKKSFFQRFADRTYNQDLEVQSFNENKAAKDLWCEAEQFDESAEMLFSYVQVFTACLNSFAHGANDVANAIGPLSAILMIYQDGAIENSAPVQKWILVYGGIGIVMGLMFFGYRVIKSLGYKVTALSPSRGACAELASSLFVVTASFLEIPVSSTQSITGAVTGVGLASGVKSVNWWFFLKVCMGWVLIFFFAVTGSALMFSMFAFTPSLV
jgi:solute carrier family 20 (sodium-dependent phosphate transporter)